MLYRIEVWLKFDIVDGREKSLVDSINSLGHHLDSIAITDLYFIKGDVSDADIEKLCQELLSDPVSQAILTLWSPLLRLLFVLVLQTVLRRALKGGLS